jgi:hypothetical protein
MESIRHYSLTEDSKYIMMESTQKVIDGNGLSVGDKINVVYFSKEEVEYMYNLFSKNKN